MSEDKQHNLPTTSPDAPAQACEQAKEYGSAFAPTPLELNDGTTIEIPPHPNLGMLDDERMAAYEELLFETESYDRGPEVYVPEQKIKDRSGNDITLPSLTRPGALLYPYRKTDPDTKEVKLISPPYSVRVVQVVLGEEGYKRLRAGGKSAGDVQRIWNEQDLAIKERQKTDSKSDGGAVDSKAVPPSDPA